jgi:predicted enzyme related to lactoylglutathione lyase
LPLTAKSRFSLEEVIMNRVIHFEFGVDNPERAIGFYAKVFGWKIEQWGGPENYWLVTTGRDGGPGIDGGMMINEFMRRTGIERASVNTIGVASIDEFVQKIVRAGGKIIIPKMAIPGVGWQAYCEDTEGNVFGIHQPDAAAK